MSYQPFNRLDPNKDIREPLHPVVQLKFGVDDFILSIPPDYLQEFTMTCRMGGFSSANFVFLDPSYGEIEKFIFLTDKENKPLLCRWGYPNNGLERSNWKRVQIRTYLPSISQGGLRISIECLTQGAEFAYIAEPSTYVGKISSVVRQIAKEMKFSDDMIFIEETSDDKNEERKQEWFSGNLSRVDMINQLLNMANSKSHDSVPYDFSFSMDGAFHFHTKYFKLPEFQFSSEETYRVFRVLYGKSTGVIDFQPRYEARRFAPLASSIVAGTYDPRTKRFLQRTLDRRNLGLRDEELDAQIANASRTTAAPLVLSSDPTEQRKLTNAYAYQATQQVAYGGRCSGKTIQTYDGSEMALTKIENYYKTMQNLMYGANLELIGLPEFASFFPEEVFCDVLVVLPNAQGSSNSAPIAENLHWSSGRYFISEIVHHISTGYIITASLNKSTGSEGTDSAKVGTPEKKYQTEEISTL